jgi:hypothetical protein
MPFVKGLRTQRGEGLILPQSEIGLHDANEPLPSIPLGYEAMPLSAWSWSSISAYTTTSTDNIS